MRLAHMAGMFPLVRGTFVTNEIIDLIQRGVDVDILAWQIPTEEVVHPEVRESGILRRTHYFRLRRLPRVILSPTFWRVLGCLTLGRRRAWSRPFEEKLGAAYFVALLRRLGHTHLHWHFAHEYGSLVAELSGVTYSFTMHSYAPLAMSADHRASFQTQIRQSAVVIAESEFCRRGMCDLVEPQHHHKIHVVRCGIDPNLFTPSPATPKDIDVICVAGFTPNKGIEYLIRATQLLKGLRPNLKVVSVGAPTPWHPKYAAMLREEQRRCGVEDTFEFAGPKTSAEVRELLWRSRVFALPSYVTDKGGMEGLPIALMEAGAVGLPLMSTDVAGIPELVEDGVTGLVVPQRDPEALATAIGRLLDDPDLSARLGAAARARVQQEFTREVSGQRLLDILRPYMQRGH